MLLNLPDAKQQVGFGAQASGSCAWPTSIDDGKIAQLIMKHKSSRFIVQDGVDGAVPTAARLEVRVHRAPSYVAYLKSHGVLHHKLLTGLFWNHSL